MAGELSPNQVLTALSQSEGQFLTSDVFPSVSFDKVKSAVDTLKSRGMVSSSQIEREESILTPEAEGIVANGSHEAKVFEAVRAAVEGLKISDLPVSWLDCMPARLDASKISYLLIVWAESSRKRKCWSWAGQGLESKMDQERWRYVQS